MSIHFRCQNCGQKLRVGDEKAGQSARCPRCHNNVIVPAVSIEPEEPPASGPRSELAPEPIQPRTETLPEIAIYDDHVEWVYESDAAPANETAVDYDKIAVPRRVLYMQGILLGVVALLSFILGLLARGSHTSEQTTENVPRPCVLSGQVTFATAGTDRPDDGSVAILVPVDRRPAPDNKAPIEGLRPGDPEPLEDNASLRILHGLGGDYTRAAADGEFRLRVPAAGAYYVLIISHHAQRPPQEELQKVDIAQIGRYFESAIDLLADRRYQWKQITLRGDQTLDARF